MPEQDTYPPAVPVELLRPSHTYDCGLRQLPDADGGIKQGRVQKKHFHTAKLASINKEGLKEVVIEDWLRFRLVFVSEHLSCCQCQINGSAGIFFTYLHIH